MTTLRDAPPLLSERLVRMALNALTASDGAACGLVVGNAGSGKTALLHRLHRTLTDGARHASIVSSRDVGNAQMPRSHVLLVDDLHLMSKEQLTRVGARAEDPAAGLIVATRPGPHTPQGNRIAEALERVHPAIVLGHVSRSDLLAHVEADDRTVAPPCVDFILNATGGISWLVDAALRAHDERDCAGDPDHRELSRMLGEQIAHRMDRLDPALRRGIQARCLVSSLQTASLIDAEPDDLMIRGYAEGLLLRSGQPAPIVRATVRAITPPRVVAELSAQLAAGLAHATAAGDADTREWLARVHSPAVAAALAREADQLLDTHPARAAALYALAVECGADAEQLREARARAAFGAGRLDEAARLADGAATATVGLADIAAATWAARGQMTHADAAAPDDGGAASQLAAFAVGRMLAPATDDGGPTTLAVAIGLLRRGLAETVHGRARPALVDLVRAAEMYSASGTTAHVPELPAVVAATAAIAMGDLEAARAVIDDAIGAGHGGPWAQRRLLLWRAWIAMQRAQPAEANSALAEATAEADASPLSPRDAVLADAVRVGLARRYADAAGLTAAWQRARRGIMRIDFDLFLLAPLTELVCSAAKVGEIELVQEALDAAIALVERLGTPLWSAHIRWAGVQRGILLNRPDDLAPHAHALVAAGATCPVAHAMARAGRVWTAVLSGTVDVDAIEAAASDLAAVGLAWDAARLAGYGAGRADDRRVSARLLACARELHPTDVARDPSDGAPDAALSERELEVARLVVRGHTYAEIGAAIFISPRTAEHHIAHIRRRLGADSRSDLIAKLRVLLGEDSPVPPPGGIGVAPDSARSAPA